MITQPDGTAVRIIFTYLAKAHVIALKRLLHKEVAKVETFNLGTGTGSSVLEVIKAKSKWTRTL
jgi:UDP-glucose 4-epimerase